MNVERERDDALAEINQLKRNLNELQEAHNLTEARLFQLQKTLTEAEEGNLFKLKFLYTNLSLKLTRFFFL